MPALHPTAPARPAGRRLALLALTSSLALALAACGGPVRIDLEPASVRLFGRGQAVQVHATPREKGGKPALSAPCTWTSSDPKVVTVAGKHLDATVTSVGPGTATVTCAVGDVKAELTAAVRMVARVTASATAQLELADEKRPLALAVEVRDDEGAPVSGRIVSTRCQDEEVCRGDARGQLWATGAGATTATVEVEGVTATVAVTVKDVRTELTKPQILKKGYMEELEAQVRKREAAEAAAAAKAARTP
jgi:hypothetical protein